MGFIVSCTEGDFYYSGDTALTFDMQLIPMWAKLNFAVLPIGDNFTMDARDAVHCAGMIECKTVVGVHYDTFGFIKIDHEKVKKIFSDAGNTLKMPKIGETIEL
jgi:L-ascorbate metabolism protein UlaG (beta-lactamase superfamily)